MKKILQLFLEVNLNIKQKVEDFLDNIGATVIFVKQTDVNRKLVVKNLPAWEDEKQMTKQLLTESIEENSSGSAFAQQDRLALEVLSKKDCVVPILKVARAGATTSLIEQAMDNNKKS